MSVVAELRATVERLLCGEVHLVRDDDEPWCNYGVVDVATQDMIGEGETESEALADALETIRGWETK